MASFRRAHISPLTVRKLLSARATIFLYIGMGSRSVCWKTSGFFLLMQDKIPANCGKGKAFPKNVLDSETISVYTSLRLGGELAMKNEIRDEPRSADAARHARPGKAATALG